MIPQNFSRENFTPARYASLFHCVVWFDLDQKVGNAYTSWRNEIYQVNSNLKVIAHPSAFKALKDMLQNFITPGHHLHQPFYKAEIYENFYGTTLYIHDGIKEVDSERTHKPIYVTEQNLKLPGKHRIIDSFESPAHGKFSIPREKIMDHVNLNWQYHKANYHRRDYKVSSEGKEVAA